MSLFTEPCALTLCMNEGMREQFLFWGVGTRVIGRIIPVRLYTLIYLVRYPETVLPRDQVLQEVWGKDYQGPRRAVDMHVRKLRRKFEQDPKTHRLIQTVHRVGYCFMPDEKVFVK
jgi:hypothetical protein